MRSVLGFINTHYLLCSVLVLGLFFAILFLGFEKRKMRAREILMLATTTALCVFFNEICAHSLPLHAGTTMVVLAGIALGPKNGLLVGALARMICNFFDGQGPWTPWQMLAWGLVGFTAGMLFHNIELKSKLKKETLGMRLALEKDSFIGFITGPILFVVIFVVLAYISFILFPGGDKSFFGWRIYAFGFVGLVVGCLLQRKSFPVNYVTTTLFTFVIVLLLYGGIMNLAAMLMTVANGKGEPSLSALRALYLTGFPYDMSHALTAALCMFLFGDSILQKFRRVQIKFGLLMVLAVSVLVGTPHTASAWSSFRDEVASKTPGITQVLTPTNPEQVGSKWELRLASGTNLAYNSTPIITENTIFVVCTNQLYQLDLQGKIQRKCTLKGSMNSVCRMAYEKGKLYIPLGGGMMECVDTTTWKSLWVSEKFQNQSLTNVTILGDMVYAGTGYEHGLFYGLDKNTGKTIWTYASENDAGYYWSGAVKTQNEGLLFAGDDGVIVSHSATQAEVFDTLDASELAGEKLRFRSGVVYDKELDQYFLISTSGLVFRFGIDDDGSIIDTTFSYMLQGAKAGEINCTATPAIYNGRMYVGGYWKNGGFFLVFDPEKMQEIYSMKSTSYFEFKGSPVVCTSYGTEENGKKVFVYFTMNGVPGGIYYIEDNEQATSGEIKQLFAPETHKQFCMDSVAVGEDGTLYYSNDSGYLFAVQTGYHREPKPTPPSAPLTRVVPGKPTKIKAKYKKKKGKWKITLSWSKGKNAAKTQITPKGAKTKVTTGKKYVFYSKKKKVKLVFYSISKDGIKSGKKTITIKG